VPEYDCQTLHPKIVYQNTTTNNLIMTSLHKTSTHIRTYTINQKEITESSISQ